MKKLLLFATAIIIFAGCTDRTPKVMARAVPERFDDFVWENDYVAYRAYGIALEWQVISPGFDVWVKKGGSLVADEWYKGATQDPDYYHHDHGGKDCYKVSKSLGGGASSPIVNGELVFPDHNYASSEINEQSPDHISFTLKYNPWTVDGHQISLSKQITVFADGNFCKAIDTYSGDFDTLTVAAGIIRHEILDEFSDTDRFAFWEKASDQSIEPEDGLIGLALCMPDADSIVIAGPANHSVALKSIIPGETVTYYFGSCWSKGNIPTSEKWFETVKAFK